MAVKAPADKRFRRGRVKTPRKRRSWKRALWPVLRGAVVVAVVGYAAHRAAGLVTAAPALRIATITVHGARRLPVRDIAERVRVLRGQNIVLADLDRARAKLLEWPWVKDATFRRALPAAIEITVTEREPIGVGRFGDRLFLVAADGTTLGAYSARHADLDLPLIDGLHVGPSRSGLLVDDARASLAADVIRSVASSSDLAGRLSQVDVSDVEDAVVMLEDEPARVHLGTREFAERLRSYVELAPTLKAKVAAIDYIDLRYDARVFVKPVRDLRR